MPRPGPSPAAVLALALLLGPAVAGGVDAQSGGARPCPRKAPQSAAPGSVTVVENRRPPCRFAFRTTGIWLRGVADGSRPDPGRAVVRDSKGRFYSANAPGWTPLITVWTPGGEYVTSIGREGEGPGELTDRGAVDIFIDGEDRLHVRDGGVNWSVFSPEHEFVRRVPGHLIRRGWPMTVILDGGAALTSIAGYDDEDRTRHFQLLDSAGAPHMAFGPVEATMARSGARLSRTLAYAGGDVFWAGPPVGDPGGYVLEEWRVDGTLRRTLRRDVPWFDSLDEERPAGVDRLHIGDDGLLLVFVLRVTGEFAQVSERARREGRRVSREERDATTEVVLEMIDTRNGELLASEVHLVSEARELLPPRLFRGGMQGAVYREGPDGVPFVDIVSVELEAR